MPDSRSLRVQNESSGHNLAEQAQGRDDIRTECAGVTAGAWFASADRRGEDLVAAGLLMLAGPVDLGELDRWIHVGWERRRDPPNRTGHDMMRGF